MTMFEIFRFLSKAQNDKILVILTFLLSYWAQRSIHKIKVQSCALKAWIFRFLSKAQNDNGYFCYAAACGLQPVGSLCANALRSKWQNPCHTDFFVVILSLWRSIQNSLHCHTERSEVSINSNHHSLSFHQKTALFDKKPNENELLSKC